LAGSKRGRGTDNKVLVAVAVEIDGKRVGRVRFGVIPDASAESLEGFIENTVEKDSTVITDRRRGCSRIKELGYGHIVSEKKVKGGDGQMLPNAHLEFHYSRGG
jgi:transposase-like protein